MSRKRALYVVAAGLVLACAPERLSIEEQLKALSGCGIELSAGVRPTDLMRFESRDDLELRQFAGIVTTLGFGRVDAPDLPIAPKLWMLDFEAIEDHGDYGRLLERLQTMTGRALPIDGVRDFVDLESGTAWLEFDLDESRIRWNARVDDDWIDPTVLLRYQQLLIEADSPIRLYRNEEPFGQAALIAAFTPDEFACFSRLSAVPMVRLEQ